MTSTTASQPEYSRWIEEIEFVYPAHASFLENDSTKGVEGFGDVDDSKEDCIGSVEYSDKDDHGSETTQYPLLALFGERVIVKKVESELPQQEWHQQSARSCARNVQWNGDDHEPWRRGQFYFMRDEVAGIDCPVSVDGVRWRTFELEIRDGVILKANFANTRDQHIYI
jgi:hypothetical protein